MVELQKLELVGEPDPMQTRFVPDPPLQTKKAQQQSICSHKMLPNIYTGDYICRKCGIHSLHKMHWSP